MRGSINLIYINFYFQGGLNETSLETAALEKIDFTRSSRKSWALLRNLEATEPTKKKIKHLFVLYSAYSLKHQI